MCHRLVRKKSRFALELEEPANAQRPVQFSEEKQSPSVDRFAFFTGVADKSGIARKFAVSQIIGGKLLGFAERNEIGGGRKKKHVRIDIQGRAIPGQRHNQGELFSCRMAVEIAL